MISVDSGDGSLPGIFGKSYSSSGSLKLFFIFFRFKMLPNGSGLCDGGAIEAQIFNFAQMFNRRTIVELCSFAPLLQNPCCAIALIFQYNFVVKSQQFIFWLYYHFCCLKSYVLSF